MVNEGHTNGTVVYGNLIHSCYSDPGLPVSRLQEVAWHASLNELPEREYVLNRHYNNLRPIL